MTAARRFAPLRSLGRTSRWLGALVAAVLFVSGVHSAVGGLRTLDTSAQSSPDLRSHKPQASDVARLEREWRSASALAASSPDNDAARPWAEADPPEPPAGQDVLPVRQSAPHLPRHYVPHLSRAPPSLLL